MQDHCYIWLHCDDKHAIVQDENAHLTGGGSDGDSEVAESGPEDDDAELDDDEDEEVDDGYMEQLAREARKLKVLFAVAQPLVVSTA